MVAVKTRKGGYSETHVLRASSLLSPVIFNVCHWRGKEFREELRVVVVIQCVAIDMLRFENYIFILAEVKKTLKSG